MNDKPHYLLPIFAIGKYYKQNDKTLLSLSIMWCLPCFSFY
ncbi:CatA-like O-acetyltransferase [Thomasclavelia ramosa]|nr:hypothetical protein I6I62_10395 [Thomasclavelia ramosa]